MSTTKSTNANSRSWQPCLAVIALLLTVAGCSNRASSSGGLSGTWVERGKVELDQRDGTAWTFNPDGSFSRTMTFAGKPESPETGTYKIRSPRPSDNSIAGDIVECASPKWDNPILFRIPPNSSTLLIKVNCDDDSLSGGRPHCWVTKQGAGPVTLQPSNEPKSYAARIVSHEKTKSGVQLLLDSKVHGKRVMCLLHKDDLHKLGDLTKLVGRQIEIDALPEEYRNVVILTAIDDEFRLVE